MDDSLESILFGPVSDVDVRRYNIEQWGTGHEPDTCVLNEWPTWDVCTIYNKMRFLAEFSSGDSEIEYHGIGGFGVVCPSRSHIVRSTSDHVIWIRDPSCSVDPISSTAKQWDGPEVAVFTRPTYRDAFGDEGTPPLVASRDARLALSTLPPPPVDSALYAAPHPTPLIRAILHMLRRVWTDDTLESVAESFPYSELRIGFDTDAVDECVLRSSSGPQHAVMLVRNPCLPVWLVGDSVEELCNALRTPIR